MLVALLAAVYLSPPFHLHFPRRSFVCTQCRRRRFSNGNAHFSIWNAVLKAFPFNSPWRFEKATIDDLEQYFLDGAALSILVRCTEPLESPPFDSPSRFRTTPPSMIWSNPWSTLLLFPLVRFVVVVHHPTVRSFRPLQLIEAIQILIVHCNTHFSTFFSFVTNSEKPFLDGALSTRYISFPSFGPRTVLFFIRGISFDALSPFSFFFHFPYQIRSIPFLERRSLSIWYATLLSSVPFPFLAAAARSRQLKFPPSLLLSLFISILSFADLLLEIVHYAH